MSERPKLSVIRGEPTAEELAALIADHAIHGWDLAVATGADARIDDDLLAALTGWFAEREDLYRGGGAVAERPPVAAKDAQEELLVAFGRDPGWTSGS